MWHKNLQHNCLYKELFLKMHHLMIFLLLFAHSNSLDTYWVPTVPQFLAIWQMELCRRNTLRCELRNTTEVTIQCRGKGIISGSRAMHWISFSHYLERPVIWSITDWVRQHVQERQSALGCYSQATVATCCQEHFQNRLSFGNSRGCPLSGEDRRAWGCVQQPLSGTLGAPILAYQERREFPPDHVTKFD